MTARSPTTLEALEWRWKFFSDLTPTEVYDLLAARNEVFVVEQNCAYGDVDGLDKSAWHLLAYAANGELAGYLRVLLPDENEPDVRIGRVLTTAGFRGIGLGSAMLERARTHITAQWPGIAISLHAQAHLQAFYGAFGFKPSSDIHDEDGIPHIWMRSA
ncbi:GNAT family N-acetyltransferase [Paraburkholderia sp. NMBU_R16]|uniref:GNAT family N-acetyltransferase n=1 Tax=Paraburkholderia sp. NMBU_R16 TaxID=2698676 RepID=UPI001564BB6B|nr:GNAT family N-acetyltransferase [Paraburkholderia sp. NMBU_R16]NRO98831.1 GNAT family N-acetyltransferase [Paraburkholderia sp. NMBU_R16]